MNVLNKLSVQKPAAVLFDTDNTLYHYEPCHVAAMKATREKAVSLFSITPEQFDHAFYKARDEVKSRLKHLASSHSRLLYFQRMLELIGLGSQVLLALDLEQTYWRTFLGKAELFDGVTDFLDDLRLAKVPTAIVTDLTAQIQFRKIVYFGLDQYFDYIVTSEEAGFDKPHPSPFKIALEKMRPGVGPIWMIGDSPVNDIKGARETIGAFTIQKIHEGVEKGVRDTRPDIFIESFGELRCILANLREIV
ncbi:HAD family hydrolase [Prodigiosinella aquatilis]|nr:HAD family hydrolase [Prodigiosinella sp. LS101]WJV55985.1 HAD family hydrolase [Prodigiosinella sp. LS101]WJV60351.1 HAD family hydrolase [Pectobacteriaceae bacterium C111]